MTRAPTGVAYNQAHDCFTVPMLSDSATLAVAAGNAVRDKLEGQLPLNGAHLRDVVLSVAHTWRAAR